MKKLLFILLIIGSGLLFIPGTGGPFVFDDTSNILKNSQVQIDDLSLDSLKNASFSTAAGPLGRPIANLTVALNHYFSGQIADPTPYKTTNIVIHIINGLLIYWLVFKIVQLDKQQRQYKTELDPALVAGLIAVAWTAHPITLTSVLYVVQRMTSLAALFTLLSLITYLVGRCKQNASTKQLAIYFILSLGFWVLALFSKENAIVLPLFIILFEYYFFSDRPPWKLWSICSKIVRISIITAVVSSALFFLIFSIQYALPGFSDRDFTMLERVMTQGRILVFYLSLIIFPLIKSFALFHDDIQLSTSLLEPATTLISILFIIGLVITAILLRKRHALIGFGIAFFFCGHLLESTFFPLELIHEHRNYLPTVGILMAIMGCLKFLPSRFRIITPALLILVFSSVTLLRAYEWSSFHNLAFYSAQHHPNSPQAQNMLTISLLQQGKPEAAYRSASRTPSLGKGQPSHYMMKFYVGALLGIEPDPKEEQLVLNHLREGRITLTTRMALLSFANFECYATRCSVLASSVNDWLKTIIRRTDSPLNRSYYHYLMGRFQLGLGNYNAALSSFYAAFNDDPEYLQPLFEIVTLYMSASQFQEARSALKLLIKAEKNVYNPRKKEIKELTSNLNKAEQLHLSTKNNQAG